MNEFLYTYGTNNETLDTKLFRWANGELRDINPLPADDCLDQLDFKNLFLFWFGDGNEGFVNYLDTLIFPASQVGMDEDGYRLHEKVL